jgi:hypothetical protein
MWFYRQNRDYAGSPSGGVRAPRRIASVWPTVSIKPAAALPDGRSHHRHPTLARRADEAFR